VMRRGDPLPGAFQAPVDVHASVDGQVYMFRHRQEIRLETVRAVKTSTTLLPATAVMHEGTAPPAGGPAVLH